MKKIYSKITKTVLIDFEIELEVFKMELIS